MFLLVQIKLILEHQHELSKLGPCERFFFEISGIKRYGTRLEVMLFKSSFEERLADLEYVMNCSLFLLLCLTDGRLVFLFSGNKSPYSCNESSARLQSLQTVPGVTTGCWKLSKRRVQGRSLRVQVRWHLEVDRNQIKLAKPGTHLATLHRRDSP